MINSSMIENSTNILVIEDFSVEIVKSFLKCIYNYKLIPEETTINSIELLSIASKYDVDDLIKVIKSYIIPTINVNNAINTLLISDKHQFLEIKTAAIDVIIKNIDTITEDGTLSSKIGIELCEEVIKYLSKKV